LVNARRNVEGQCFKDLDAVGVFSDATADIRRVQNHTFDRLGLNIVEQPLQCRTLQESSAFNGVGVATPESTLKGLAIRDCRTIVDRESLFFRWQGLFVFDRQALTGANCGFEFFGTRAHLIVRMARLDIQKEKDCFLDWVLHRLLIKRQGA
jgi:hypothetical protein